MICYHHIICDFLFVAEMSAPESINKSHIDVLKTIPDAWMLRECQCYHDEAKACKSMKGRFYQYYVHGEMRDCSEWTENHDDCKVVSFNLDNQTSLTKFIYCSCGQTMQIRRLREELSTEKKRG